MCSALCAIAGEAGRGAIDSLAFSNGGGLLGEGLLGGSVQCKRTREHSSFDSGRESGAHFALARGVCVSLRPLLLHVNNAVVSVCGHLAGGKQWLSVSFAACAPGKHWLFFLLWCEARVVY